MFPTITLTECGVFHGGGHNREQEKTAVNVLILTITLWATGITAVRAKDQPHAIAVVTFLTANGQESHRNTIPLALLHEDNMKYECRKREDGYYHADSRNDYTYMLRIAESGDGVLKIWGGSTREEKSALEASFISALAMPTAQNLISKHTNRWINITALGHKYRNSSPP